MSSFGIPVRNGLGVGLLASTSLSTRNSSAFSPAALFAAGEQGAWYDPSDLTTLFQDSAGATPVTAAGQSVGLLLDKSQGAPATGPELVTNGDFSGGATGWTVGTNWSISSGSASKTAGASGNLSQSATITNGRFYRITFDLTISGGSMWVGVGAVGGFANAQTTSGAKTLIVPATGAAGAIYFEGGTGAVITIDNISVRELAGNHATQSNAAQRPTYGVVPVGGRRNLYTNTNDLTNLTNWPNGNILNGTRTGAGVSVTTNEGYAYIARPVNADTFVSGVTYTFSATVVCDQTIANVPIRLGTPFGNAGATVNMVAGVPQRITRTITASGSGTSRSEFGIDARNAIVPGGSDATGYTVTFSDPQFEIGSTATAYQKVVSAFDVTEAGVPSLSYLSFDGSDDGMLTATITPGTDKAQVFAGVRKLSDAAAQLIAETSVSSTTEAGTIGLLAAVSPGGGDRLNSRGTTRQDIFSFNVAPTTLVHTGLADISAPSLIFRTNGVQAASSTSGQGTGDYLAYPLYIGRRGGTTLPFNGRIYSLIVRFGANLDAATITSAETYVGNETGVNIPLAISQTIYNRLEAAILDRNNETIEVR